MESTPEQSAANPLGLSLDFVYGRGYLWAQRQRVSDWIAMESLRMEIPDLKFPFDARGGLERFQHTRCLVREAEFAISEVGLGDLLSDAVAEVEGFDHLRVGFLEDAIHISVKLTRFGADTYVSCRAALLPPEPARADELHLSLYDYRAYGALPYPARVVMQQLMTGLLNTERLRLSGRGESFTPGMAGDILRFRPLKLLFLKLFPRVGWKLPDLSGVTLERAEVRPGVIAIRASDGDHQAEELEGRLVESREGARALAAYEAKELFAHADKALFEGEMRQALALLAGYRDVYGLHPELVARQLDALIADASPGHLAEAESLRRELVDEDGGDLQAALAAPLLAVARRRGNEEVVEAFEGLARVLRERDEGGDWALCQLAMASRLAEERPRLAAEKLQAVLKRQPRHREALERSQELYRRVGDGERLEEMLKRLTGVYQDRQELKETYLKLARHLMDREGDLGEARMYLEKVLRLDDSDIGALKALGESYMLGDEPLRALKAFGSAARIAEGQGKNGVASRLHGRAGQLWFEEMDDARQALLGIQRALTLSADLEDEEGSQEGFSAEERADQFRQAARLAEVLGRDEEAIDYWQEAIQIWERRRDRGARWVSSSDQEGGEAAVEKALVEGHLELARRYQARQRPSAAASQMRRVLELRSGHEEALAWLEEYLRSAGQPEELIALYEDLLEECDEEGQRLQWLEKVGDLLGAIGHTEEARRRYEAVLEVVPRRVKVRQKLVELLGRHGRYETLARSLEELRGRFEGAGREERFELEMAIGEAYGQVGRWRKAARALGRAVNYQVGSREALREMAGVLEKIVDEEGPSASAPVGSKPVGQLLESMWLRLAELEPEARRSREWLLRVAISAEERGDMAVASEARERADALALDDDAGGDADIDERLDAMLDALNPVPADAPEEAPETTVNQMEVDEQERGPQRAGKDDPDEEELSSFRRRFQKMMKKPAPLEKPDKPDKAATLQNILEGAKRREQDLMGGGESEDVEVGKQDEPPKTRRVELPRPASLGESEVSSNETGGGGGVSTSLEAARRRVEEARREGPSAQAEAMEDLLRLAKAAGPQAMSTSEEARVARELGELRYYELEDDQGARPYLERARRLDPSGAGSETGVVNALEQIYKDSGDIEARTALLKGRLESAETVEMKSTYRLLLAQLVWDQGKDGDGARRWLDAVLEDNPNHEAAHRLLSEIAKEEGDFEGAARHLEAVIDAASGGLDEVEMTRELADLYHQRLDDPQRGQACYERVLAESPGDARALNGVKACVADLGRWRAYIKALERELGLLMGRPTEPVDLKSWDVDAVPPAIRVSASQIVGEAAQVMEESIEDREEAHRLWGMAQQLWPENGEALERRIGLDRSLGKQGDLVADLEAYAAVVLDDETRFETLLEAAEQCDDEAEAQRLFGEALEAGSELKLSKETVEKLRRRSRASTNEEQE